MNLLSAAARRLARRRLALMQRHAMAPTTPQRQIFDRLLARLAPTAFGRAHDLARVRCPADLARAVALQDYDSLQPWWRRARDGERDVVWPGRIRFWAISSGTTSGEKYLPVSAATIANNRRGGFDALVPHLADSQRHTDLFGGRMLFLGGSTAMRRQRGAVIGDNTGIMALHVPRCLRHLHAPGPATRALTTWQEKVQRAAIETARCDLRMLAGVPSWILLFGEAVLQHCRVQGRNVATLRDVWPRLQLFVHGGVTFAPYAARCRELIGGDIRYTDTYSASEGGMLAVQERRDDPAMLPLLDRSTFFEFVPQDELGRPDARRLTIDQVEPDVDYAVALTTDSGIVSYLVGDLVRFTSTRPLRLVFAGRIAHTLNAFGEHLSGGELDRATAAAAEATGSVLRDFAVGVRYPDQDQAMGGHWFLLEFHRAPADLERFRDALDAALQRGNEDYASHRSFGLLPPRVSTLPDGAFLSFLRRRGKLGGQHKLPRVLDTAQLAELTDALSEPLR